MSARTIDYWYQQLIAQKNATPALDGLDSTSKTADFNLWLFIVATVMYVLDSLFDLHKSNVDASLANLKPHRLEWYRNLALRFQHGQETIPGTDQYANEGLTPEQIAAQLIITQAAVTEVDGALRMKVVTTVDDDYAQLTDDQKTAFSVFINDQKDGGVKVRIESLPPDGLKLVLDIFYNPLVLRTDGSRIDGNAVTPVNDAIAIYLKNLKFNGEYSNTRLSDQLKLVDGVVLPVVKSAQAQYGEFPYSTVDELYIPDGGYLRIPDGGLTINYRAYV